MDFFVYDASENPGAGGTKSPKGEPMFARCPRDVRARCREEPAHLDKDPPTGTQGQAPLKKENLGAGHRSRDCQGSIAKGTDGLDGQAAEPWNALYAPHQIPIHQ